MTKLPGHLAELLKASGRAWSVHQGNGHKQLRIEGHLVGVFHSGPNAARVNQRSTRNLESQIKRYLSTGSTR